MVTIDLKKRDLWILTALIFFLIGIGLVVGFGNYVSGNPKVMGHSSDEIMVLNKSGVEVTLQKYIDNLSLGSNIQYAQAFRKDAGNRPIITVNGSSSAFVALDDKSPYNGSQFSQQTLLDGIGCNGAQGWKITGCWIVVEDAGSGKLFPYNNGCITRRFDDPGDSEMSIACIKIG